jgi:hypothetical protein
MNLNRDLTNPRWMYLKAVLFLFIGLVSAAALLVESPTLRTAVLLILAIWAFCRLYYFLFYVIEKYIDPGYRFGGILSALRHRLSNRSGA